MRFAAPRDVDIGSVTVRDVTFVDGSVLEITDNGPTILVDWVQSEAGTRHRSLGDRVRVAEGELATIETERVEAGKTAALVVGGAAAFAGVMFAIFNSDTSASGDQPGPGETPNPFSLVLTRLLLPF